MVGSESGAVASPRPAREPLLHPCGAGWEGKKKKKGRGRDTPRLERRPAPGGRVRWVARPRCLGGGGARSRARRLLGRRAELWGSGLGKAALLRLPAPPCPAGFPSPRPPSSSRSGRGRTPRPPPGGVVSLPGCVCVPLPARTSPPRPSRLGSGGGRGRSARPHPHPTRLRPWRRPRLPSFPHPALRTRTVRIPPVASRGLCGVTGGRLPVAGPFALPRRLPPPALDLARLGRSPVVRCSGPAARAPGASPRPPSEPRGFLPLLPPQPRLLWLPVRFSRPLASPLTAVACPPARLVPRFPSEPLPSALGGGGGEGCLGTRARVRGAPVDGGREWTGSREGGRVCEVGGG